LQEFHADKDRSVQQLRVGAQQWIAGFAEEQHHEIIRRQGTLGAPEAGSLDTTLEELMIRFLALVLAALTLGAVIAPDLRQPMAWVLAFFSLLMLGDLIRSAFAKLRRRSSHSAPPRGG
jgi:hypothetical protein